MELRDRPSGAKELGEAAKALKYSVVVAGWLLHGGLSFEEGSCRVFGSAFMYTYKYMHMMGKLRSLSSFLSRGLSQSWELKVSQSSFHATRE